MTPPRERARPLAPDERRAAIIDATRQLLIEHQGSLTTKQIAEACGIAEGTIFRVFDSKRELMRAVVEDTFNPSRTHEYLERAVAGAPDLRTKLEIVVDEMMRNMRQAMAVLMAVHAAFPDAVPSPKGGKPEKPRKPGPPHFIVEANKALIVTLTEVIFEPHADDLRVAPHRAAIILRGLTMGVRHPGFVNDDEALNADEVADVLLDGITVPTSRGD